MTRKTCKKAVGPRRLCGNVAVAKVWAKGRWNPICRKHVAEFHSLLRSLGAK